MHWQDIDWQILESLRAPFLAAAKTQDYWRTLKHLEHYDHTFAQRIGWKWDAVLEEIDGRKINLPASTHLVDWGCGSGIATRRVLTRLGEDGDGPRFTRITLIDRSPLAQSFAAASLGRWQQKAKDKSPEIREGGDVPEPGYTLLLSHVLGELDKEDLNELRNWIDAAAAVIWVEAGTPAIAAKLVAEREFWKSRFAMLAPCPHQAECGMLNGENKDDWCHFFAPPPPGIFSDSDWTNFGKRMKIDLRSLPVSFLVMAKNGTAPDSPGKRVIGRPRLYNGYATYLGCTADGAQPRGTVKEYKFLKRDGKAQYRDFKEVRFTRFIY